MPPVCEITKIKVTGADELYFLFMAVCCADVRSVGLFYLFMPRLFPLLLALNIMMTMERNLRPRVSVGYK